MEQETGKIDLARWVIMHDSPLLAWLGELHDPVFWQILDEGQAPAQARGHIKPALVMHTMLAQGPGGMGILTHVMPPHGLAAPLTLQVDGQRVTPVRELAEGDQHELRSKIEAALQAMLMQRARQSGIAIPGRQ